MADRHCKDCEPGSKRPAPYPGPRCSTHNRARKKAANVAAHGRRVVMVYGITPEEYAALYVLQGGVCFVCRRATGATKRLAVEHDHVLARQHGHPDGQACRWCITGLSCGPCNRDILGRLGRNPDTYERIAATLRNLPARQLWPNQT